MQPNRALKRALRNLRDKRRAAATRHMLADLPDERQRDIGVDRAGRPITWRPFFD